MQSCLERVSMERRHESEARSDYSKENQYDAQHPDALATGDAQGKGTGHPGGEKIWLPNCNGQLGIIDYSNYDTSLESGAGNKTDNDTRNKSVARSLYNKENAYGAQTVDTSANYNEGQYRQY